MLINNYDSIDYRILLPYYIAVTCFKYKNKGRISVYSCRMSSYENKSYTPNSNIGNTLYKSNVEISQYIPSMIIN